MAAANGFEMRSGSFVSQKWSTFDREADRWWVVGAAYAGTNAVVGFWRHCRLFTELRKTFQGESQDGGDCVHPGPTMRNRLNSRDSGFLLKSLQVFET